MVVVPVKIDSDLVGNLDQVDQSSQEAEEGNVESQDQDQILPVEEEENRGRTEVVDNNQETGAEDVREEGNGVRHDGLEVDPGAGQVWRSSKRMISKTSCLEIYANYMILKFQSEGRQRKYPHGFCAFRTGL